MIRDKDTVKLQERYIGNEGIGVPWAIRKERVRERESERESERKAPSVFRRR